MEWPLLAQPYFRFVSTVKTSNFAPRGKFALKRVANANIKLVLQKNKGNGSLRISLKYLHFFCTESLQKNYESCEKLRKFPMRWKVRDFYGTHSKRFVNYI
jgi:hypothetical protein